MISFIQWPYRYQSSFEVLNDERNVWEIITAEDNLPDLSRIYHIFEECRKRGIQSHSFGMIGEITYYDTTGEVYHTDTSYVWLAHKWE